MKLIRLFLYLIIAAHTHTHTAFKSHRWTDLFTYELIQRTVHLDTHFKYA